MVFFYTGDMVRRDIEMVTTLSQKKQILKLYGIRAAPRRN
jgi:hypothetical protein